MTPEQKIKHLILAKYQELDGDDAAVEFVKGLDADAVDSQYEELVENEAHWDAVSETREGTAETNLPCEWSRHYESKAVAAQYFDGSWVGWTYWYGGGKHGCPEEVEWINSGYDLTVTEEEKVVTVRAFAKVEPTEDTPHG